MLNLNEVSKGAKIRFFCWLAIAIFFIVCFIRIFYSGFSLDTNILNLLPQSKQNITAEKASDQFSKTMGNQIIFLIGNPSQVVAQKAADKFFGNIKQSSLFQNINYQITTNEQEAWGSFYYPYRLNLLTQQQRKLLQENKADQLVSSALFNLYSPFGMTNSSLLQSDPFFLFQKYLMSRPKPASHIELVGQRMMVNSDNQWYVMGTAKVKEDSFSIANQNKVTHLIQANKTSVIKAFPETSVFMNGMIFYAKAGADEAQRNISTIGVGSLIGIILLIFLTFRSLKPMLNTLLSGFFGFLAAFVVTQYFFGSVYLFTLVFGASLIGIVVDYAFFYYSDQLVGGQNWNSMQGLKNIIPGISLGLINIVLAYVVLSLTPFPGLRQLAVFSITGLIVAYATVVCVFPMLLKAKHYSFKPVLLTFANQYLNLWRKLSVKKIVIIYILILIVSVIGIYRLKPNDDIRILQSVPAQLKLNENKVKEIIGSDIGLSFYVVEGDTPTETLSHEAMLANKINQVFPSVDNKYIAISDYIPSISAQKENFDLITTRLINPKLIPYLEKIGVNKQKARQIQRALLKLKYKPVTVQDWLNSPVSKSLRYLWLGKVDNKYAGIVLLSDKLNVQQLKHATQSLSFATYVNKADQISQTFKVYREKISILLLIVYLVLLLLLIARYSFKRAILYFLPPAAACALSLAVLGWLNVPLTLFNLLAVFLILGVGVDYVLFFAETKSSYQGTMLAVSLSAIITILSFGLLALSATPVIHYFGITVLVGITSAFILAPLASRLPLSRGNLKTSSRGLLVPAKDSEAGTAGSNQEDI